MTSSYLLNLVLRRATEYVFPLIVFARDFIHTDIELLVARLIFVDYPEPYQRHHYRIIIPNEPMYCESSPLDLDHGSPCDLALDEEFFLPQGRSTRLEPTTKTPGKRKSLSKRISGAMTKISRRLFCQKTRPKSQERSRAKSQKRGQSKSQERGRSKSQERGRSKSQERGRSKSQERGRSESQERGRSKSQGRGRSKSQERGRVYDSEQVVSLHANRRDSVDQGVVSDALVFQERQHTFTQRTTKTIQTNIYTSTSIAWFVVSSPMQVGRRLRPVASVSALHGRDAKLVALSSSFRSRYPKSVPSNSLPDGEQYY